MLQRLLGAGASVNARTNEGFTPLVEAVRCAPLQSEDDSDEVDHKASHEAYEQHKLAANLLVPQSEFTRDECDNLKKLCNKKDSTIMALRKEIEDFRAEAEKDRLFCLQRENDLRTASKAILCLLQSIFTQKICF